MPVLLLAVGQLVASCERHISPLTTTPRSAASPEQRADGRALGAQALVGVAAPVGEEQVVARPEAADLRHETGEVRAAVHVGVTALPVDQAGSPRAGLPVSSAVRNQSSIRTPPPRGRPRPMPGVARMVNTTGASVSPCEDVRVDVLARNNVVVTGRRDGSSMLFAHGFGCDQNMWRLVAPAFEADYRVVLFDHVGAGGVRTSAAWDRAALRLAATATPTTCWRSCGELDLRDVVFVGHSVSAMIGVLAAIAEPERFAELVLVDPVAALHRRRRLPRRLQPRPTSTSCSSRWSSNYLGWSRAMAPVIMGNPDRPELGRGARPTASAAPTPRSPACSPGPPSCPTTAPTSRAVRVPTLVAPVHARRDRAAGRSARTSHDTIPDSRARASCDATGHCPHLSAPDATTAAIARLRPRAAGTAGPGESGQASDRASGRAVPRCAGGGRPERLYEYAPCGYLSTAPDGTIVKINATSCGWLRPATRAELVGRRASRTCSPSAAGSTTRPTSRRCCGCRAGARDRARPGRRPDGRRLPVLVNVHAGPDDGRRSRC